VTQRIDIAPTPAPPPRKDALDEELDRLYESHAGIVERWVRRLVGPAGEVQDLIHDVFVVALRRRREFRGDARPQTWLFRITQNVVASRRRRDRLRRWLLARHTEDPSTQPATPGTPLEHIERREQQARLYAALERLPEAYRTAIILYELEGLSGQEIADLLGEDVNAVWVRLHRARTKLLRALAAGGRA
jgi:RNA polymerase sigma-70 factor (ECF subfamily)